MKHLLSLFAFVAIVITFAACGGKDGNNPEINGGNGNNNGGNGEQENEIAALPGKFTVNPDGDQVQFSPGCLTKANGLSFYHNTLGAGSYGMYYYFSWGTGDAPTFIGTKSQFKEWGHNPIYPETEGDRWRTLSAEEWMHLFSGRYQAKYLCGFAEVERLGTYYKGCLLFPDNAYDLYFNYDKLHLPDNMMFRPYATNNCFRYGQSVNKYSEAEWNKLEREVGVVFIAERGVMLNDTYTNGSGWDAIYCWTSTPTNGDDTKAKCLVMKDDFTFNNIIRDVERNMPNPVRLVKNVPPSE